MSYIPSDFDNLDGGLNILDIIENSSVLPHFEGNYSDKGLGYKQQFSIYGDLSYEFTVDPTHLTMDFCYILKNSYILDAGTNITFKMQVYIGDGQYETLNQEIDLTNYQHTVTQDSDGNEVWLYEGFDLNNLTILNNLSDDTIFTIEFYTAYTSSQTYHRVYLDLCARNRNGKFNTQPDEMPIVINYLYRPTVSSFTIARKDNISELMEVQFSGTFDNQNLGAMNNDITELSIEYVNPNTHETISKVLQRDVDYTINGNTFYSGTGSSASTIDVDIEEMFYQGMFFAFYVNTQVNYASGHDSTYDNLPVFDWGNDGTKYLNVNGEFRVNNNKLIDLIYPVGSIYMSVNSTNPSTLFGGTWVAWGTGRVPVGIDTSQSEFNTIEKTGGEKTHILNINEIPSHNHTVSQVTVWGEGPWIGSGGYTTLTFADRITSSAGGGQAHNILQPYITCYMWKRTA